MESTGLIINTDASIEEFDYAQMEDFNYLISDFTEVYEMIEQHELEDGSYEVYGKFQGGFNRFELLSVNARGKIVVIKKNLDGYPVSINESDFLRYYRDEDDLDETILEELCPNDEDYNYNDGFCVYEDLEESGEIDYC